MGILLYWFNNIVSDNSFIMDYYLKSPIEDNSFEPLNIEEVSGAFYLLGIGLTISFLIFLLEQLTYKLRHKIIGTNVNRSKFRFN